MGDLKHKAIHIDEILKELGWFGRYQKKRWLLFVITIWAMLLVELSYAFTTINPKYRCLVSICETENNTEYKPIWLNNAVPFKENQPSRCEQFQIKNHTEQISSGECDSELFNVNVKEECDEFVFNTNHTTIIEDFKLLCEKVWMIAMPGTAHSVALLIFLPTSGYIADRIGRKKVAIYGLILGKCFCLIKSFSSSIWIFVIFEFLEMAGAAGAFTSMYTLIAEFTPSGNRLFGCVLSFACIAFAEVSLACIAWLSYSWRLFLRLVIIPSSLVLLFIPFFIPESIRWLISQNKISDAIDILENIAKENGTELKEAHKLQLKVILKNSKESNKICKESLKDVLKSIPMIVRIVVCAFVWMSCAFIYHGLFLMSGEISGNQYLNFTLVGLAEMPGSFISYISCRRYGRKVTISMGLIIVGFCCGSYIFIPDGHRLRLMMFLLAKCVTAATFCSLYIIAAEIYPTPFRQTLFSLCSMIGRTGQLLAPQMPVLATVWPSLPLLLFCLISITAGILSLLLPETVNTTLPDTIQEAVNINKNVAENTKL